MRRKIYHIAIDEKFINTAYYQFSKATDIPNEFYILTKDLQARLQHATLQENCYVLHNTPKEKDGLVRMIGVEDIVVFHSLIPWFYAILFALPKKTQTIWLCYGFELYNDPVYFSKKEIYAPQTLSYFGNKPTIIPIKENIGLKVWLTSVFRNVKRGHPKDKKQRALDRIDYIGTSFKEEFAALSSKLHTNKRFFEYWHYPLEQILNLEQQPSATRKNILIGNSGTPTLNHIDVFYKINQTAIAASSKIVVPLSYGLNEYIDAVKTMGAELFGDSFYPLEDFIPLVEYNKVLREIDVAIFYNYRQQALGNIVALLYMGAKVYLSNKNPIYHFFKRMDVVIFDFDKEFVNSTSLQSLSKEEVTKNRTKLFELLNVNSLSFCLKNELRKLSV